MRQNDHFVRIYTAHAADYQRMIDAEDVDGNLQALLSRLVDFEGRRVVDVGSGTGRIPRLLHQKAVSGLALDIHADMLRENRRQQAENDVHWPLIQGDVHEMPLADDCADVVTAGWAIGHFCDWYGPVWRQHIARALQEMLRIARPGGDLLIMETLGTGVLFAAPPTEDLAAYYALLQRSWGFERHVVATDYLFGSVSEAIAATAFFFGETLVKEIERRNWRRIPEWTGVWHLRT
jgi:ubiquinone/menaquinone biosynthesis C-methylase UbiE